MSRAIMLEFADGTGLLPAGTSPERYLWTDAFAVCNFLGLYRKTGDEQYRRLALLLVDQVHDVLGRFNSNDRRTGWISGLAEEEGKRHPAMGGIRIGKKLTERKKDEPLDEQLEWDRDGQYFHYLTQWMHALSCVSRITGDPTFNAWAIELAKTAHARFSYTSPRGQVKRLHWKMSVDLSYPLVPSMGHHDPLDGLITYCELQATAGKLSGRSSQELTEEIADMAAICEGKDWATDDPLGIGGLLTCAYRMAELIVSDGFTGSDFFETVVKDSLRSLGYFEQGSPLNLPAYYRLAFRELGLSTGLQAIRKLQEMTGQHPDLFLKLLGGMKIERFDRYIPLSGAINAFWMEDRHREAASWKEHRNINMVMLATSLAPEGYLIGLE
jgi:hypothetical protein